MTRIPKTLLIVCACLSFVLPSAWLIWFAVERHGLNAALADLRAKGKPTSFAELAPPPIPDEENAVPVYSLAYTRYEGLPDETRSTLEHLIRKRSPLTEEEVNQARVLLDSCADVFALIHQGDQKPSFRLTVNYAALDPDQWTLPEVGDLRRLADLLRLSAKIEFACGRYDQAPEHIDRLLHISHGLYRAPILIVTLTAISTEGAALNTLETFLDRSDAEETVLRSLLQSLPDPEDRTPIIRVLSGERALGLSVLRFARTAKTRASSSRSSIPRRPSILAEPFFAHEELIFLQGMDALISLARQPTADSPHGLEDWDKEFLENRYSLLAKVLLSSNSRASVAQDNALARRGLARLAVTLRLYRMESGHYPDSLSQLVPDFLDKLLSDPFSRKDFVYRKEGQGFVLYSVGDDLTDDGGAQWDQRHPGHSDIVWKCSR